MWIFLDDPLGSYKAKIIKTSNAVKHTPNHKGMIGNIRLRAIALPSNSERSVAINANSAKM